jgi:uncharacterized membrane protein
MLNLRIINPCNFSPAPAILKFHMTIPNFKTNITTSKEIFAMAKKKKKNFQSKNAQNKKVTLEKRQAKKDMVLGAEKKGRLPLIVAMVCSVLIVGGGIYYATYDRSQTAPVAGSFTSENIASQVSLPANLFEDGKARHFQHVAGEFNIKYFVLKSSDGIIRAAFDACDVCWPAGKGYYQEGDSMVCRNCGRKFASVLVNEVKGGCNPAPLNRRVENGKVIIEVKDILDGRQYFNFSGKA